MVTDSGSSTSPATPGRRPGRPRSERARIAVLEAAADLLVAGGWPAATIEAVAAQAGVSKVTIYKWWPSRGAVAIDGYFHRYRATSVFDDTGDLAGDLVGQIRLLVGAFRGRAGEIMAELIGQAQTDAALGDILRVRWLAPRRAASAVVLRRAVERGEIRRDTDIPLVMDQLYAPIYYRLLMRHEPLTGDLAERLVHTTLEGIWPGVGRTEEPLSRSASTRRHGRSGPPDPTA